MSTERDNKTHDVEFICDRCCALVLGLGMYTASDYVHAWDDLKREGWRAWREDRKWKHACPNCVKSGKVAP